MKRQLNNARKCFPLNQFSPATWRRNRTKGEKKAKQEEAGKFKGSGEKNRATRYSPTWGQTVSAIKRSSAVRKFGPHIDGLLIIFSSTGFFTTLQNCQENTGDTTFTGKLAATKFPFTRRFWSRRHVSCARVNVTQNCVADRRLEKTGMEFTLTLNGFTVEPRRLGVSRCEFMGLGHPLSKVYLRRPWRTFTATSLWIWRILLLVHPLCSTLPLAGSISLIVSSGPWCPKGPSITRNSVELLKLAFFFALLIPLFFFGKEAQWIRDHLSLYKARDLRYFNTLTHRSFIRKTDAFRFKIMHNEFGYE